MRFELQATETSPASIVDLDQYLRMPLDAYGSSGYCKIIDAVEMADLNWKIVLDEAFRSVQNQGVVEFKFREFARYDLRRMWHFLGRPTYNRKCSLVEYSRILGNEHRVKVNVTRTPRNGNTWSICYISDGRNIAQINGTAELVAENADVEILVSGPIDRLSGLSPGITVVDDHGLPRDAMISLKKNMLVAKAKNENLLLLHDRYLLSEDFFDHFAEFGYDFDVAVPRQMYYGSSVEYPGLLAEESNQILAVEQPINRDDFAVNGGCIVIKRELALATPLNSFLAWQEAEDFEWTTRLIQNGELPRPVRRCVVYTVGTDQSKTANVKPTIFMPSKVDFLSELDCLLSNHPLVFFEQLPHLLQSYSLHSKYSKKLENKCHAFRRSWIAPESFHMTPLRFCFALTLSLSIGIGANALQSIRKEAFFAFRRYSMDIIRQSQKRSLGVALMTIWQFFWKYRIN